MQRVSEAQGRLPPTQASQLWQAGDDWQSMGLVAMDGLSNASQTMFGVDSADAPFRPRGDPKL